MDKQRLTSTLQQLAGHLVIETPEQQRQFERLTESLSESPPGDDSFDATTDFSIARTDLFSVDHIPLRRRETLDNLATRLDDATEPPSQRVFVREVPLLDPLLGASVPDWATGAKISKTIGPFVNKDGRQFWFDFYPIVTFTALYVQGIAKPVLLFKSERRIGPIVDRGGYELSRGSFWILSTVLTPGAPPNTYVGLAIDGGRISLNTTPQVHDGVLTVSSATRVTVELDLSAVTASEPDHPTDYGVDARTATVHTPRRFVFHFSGAGRTIDEITAADWDLYGQHIDFTWNSKAQPAYDAGLKRIVIPYRVSQSRLDIVDCDSPFHGFEGAADIHRAGWALPVATIDVAHPLEAQGSGGMMVQTGDGITDRWANLRSAPLRLAQPAFLLSPGQITVSDATSGGPQLRQRFNLWRDALNAYGTTVDVTFSAPMTYAYVSASLGTEIFTCVADADFELDRPVAADGEPPRVRSKHSTLMVSATDTQRLFYLYDDNLLQDSGATDTMAIALTNALFKVSQANGCLLFGMLSEDYATVENGLLFLTFGLYTYLPMLPDPYAANLSQLRRPTGTTVRALASTPLQAWLVARVRWQPPVEEINDVGVSFHFAPLANQFGGVSFTDDEGEAADDTHQEIPISGVVANAFAVQPQTAAAAVNPRQINPPLPDYVAQWDQRTGQISQSLFSLLDVSTNADLMGVSFAILGGRTTSRVTHVPVAAADAGFPIQADGMDVVSAGRNVRVFTVPQISWEPLINLTKPDLPNGGDPPMGFNYYPDDGGPTQIINNSDDTIALAPLPVTDHLLGGFEDHPETFAALAFMTLPFGMKTLALLSHNYPNVRPRQGTRLSKNSEDFGNELKGALQLRVDGGEAVIPGESDMFVGSTMQLNNVLDYTGAGDGDSTLGRSVTIIYNNEFFEPTNQLVRERGVPLERIDLSGYGASAFSNWLNPKAAFAQTSQAKFDVFVGRCAHEIIQVKSIIYPWGIKVVRTITMFRVGSGYVYRHDSGWKAESNGEFDFRYFVNVLDGDGNVIKDEKPSPFAIHPGVVKGLFNVANIIETPDIAVEKGSMPALGEVEGSGIFVEKSGLSLEYELQPVYFDADIEVEETVSGFTKKKIGGVDRNVVASRKILGYVQLAPRGIPIAVDTLRNLVTVQLGSIGGSIDCVASLAASGQKIRLNRFDFNNSFGANGSDVEFAVAGRGNVLLPKDGAWSMVKHERGSGNVTPVPSDLSVPVIRVGKLVKDGDGQKLDTPAKDALVRIADPFELLRAPVASTVNYGFLQSMDTQKALFLTPAFQHGLDKMFSKSPPLFVDAFRIVNSKAIFPNVGDAQTAIGDAISLTSNAGAFAKGALKDGGADVWQLMDVTSAAENAAQAGYKLLKQIPTFPLPTEFDLIDLGDGNFRIYIQYKPKNVPGALDYDVDSAAANIADTWKSNMEGIALVVDLAGIDALMTISGRWDSKKGSEASYPQPKMEFAPELSPVIEILQILAQLQGGDYAAAVASGLKLAMSNKAGSWEYKFEASKEIPVLRFPPTDILYNAPNCPLKLEAGMKIGAYFNAALQVPSSIDAKQLLPTAGGFMGFYGRLSVMCVSLEAATIYAIGQVNLDIAADTKAGPSLRMKFGFGAQIVVGLPVVGNVSVLYMVGVEIFAASNQLDLTAFLRFEGHAELLGGIVGVTITIEAKGTVSRKAIGSGRTDLACEVTFGLDISIFLVIDISFSTSWSEQRQIA
jgi:hypothetical protein